MKSGYDRIGSTVSLERAKRSCLDKMRHESRNDARDAAAKIRKKHPDSGRRYIYRCTLCHGFHLTSKQPAGLKQGKPNGERRRQKIVAPQYGRLPEEG